MGQTHVLEIALLSLCVCVCVCVCFERVAKTLRIWPVEVDSGLHLTVLTRVPVAHSIRGS